MVVLVTCARADRCSRTDVLRGVVSCKACGVALAISRERYELVQRGSAALCNTCAQEIVKRLEEQGGAVDVALTKEAVETLCHNLSVLRQEREMAERN